MSALHCINGLILYQENFNKLVCLAVAVTLHADMTEVLLHS